MSVTDDRKKVFVVLGMARTGTSAIARSLKVFGVDLGDALTESQAEWNPTGFWEDKDIVYGINGRIFNKLGFLPYGLLTLSDADQTSFRVNEIRDEACKLLSARLSHSHSYGFKDPSTIKLVPFWRSVFKKLNVDDHYLITLRNPLASARSYQKLTGSELELCLLMWCAHLLQAVESTHGLKRMVVSYDLLLQNPRHELQRIAHAFKLDEVNEADADFYAQQFLNKNLNRFQSTDDEFASHPVVRATLLCQEIYGCLLDVAQDKLAMDGDEFAARWQQINSEYNKLAPMYIYIDRLLKERNQLRRALRDIHKSILWKLLRPLTLIDHYFRTRRRAKRMYKRLVKAYG